MIGKNGFFERIKSAFIIGDGKDDNGAGKMPVFRRASGLRPFPLAVLFTTLKMLLFAFIVVGFGGLGLAVGVGKAYIDTVPELDIAQLTISDRTSFLYDMNGDLITSIASTEYRDWVDIEEIPEMLQNAFIAIEDVRFYKHSGVDFKRLFSAALEVLGNSDSSGGSTITQQLVKNKILTSERTYKRKVQEAYLALQVEKMIGKADILEAYLNDVYLGESNYGVKIGAMDYFGKELSELTIRECAMLAGLVQSPYRYNPRKNTYERGTMDVTNARTDRVLSAMYQAGYITAEQYNAALAEEVTIFEISEQKQLYDHVYFVEYAIYDVITHLLEQRGLEDNSTNRTSIENELRTGGYHIYTTLDPSIQTITQTTLSTWDKYPTLADSTNSVLTETNSDGTVIETVEPQSAAVVLDYHTGELRAIIGGRDEPTIRKGLNRAYQSYTEVGSAIKPLTVYGPALDMGLSPATIIANMEGEIEGWGTEKGYPSGGLDRYYGPVTLRRGLMSSLNVVAARTLLEHVTIDRAIEYLELLGATKSQINSDGSGLALGTSGLTPIQMAAAYGTIANGGIYLEPLSFTKVLDSDGNVILDADAVREKHRVFQESTAYLLVDMMTSAVESGTGTKAKISGMTVAGKTGTNSDYASVYFGGITPYYTATVWIGHDYPVNKLRSGSSGGDYAAPLWQAFMSQILEGKENAKIIDADPSSLGLVKKTVCSVSGLLATDACFADEDHEPVTDYFLASEAPTTYCNVHVLLSICKDSGALSTTFCPEESIEQKSIVLIRASSQFSKFTDAQLLEAIPNAVRTELSSDAFIAQYPTCTLHSGETLAVFELKAKAEALISSASILLSTDQSLTDTERKKLSEAMDDLQAVMNSFEYAEIEPPYEALRETFKAAGGVL